MSRIAVLGESPQVDFYRPAGATVLVAEGSDAVRAAWESLPDDVAVVVLTAAAASHLPREARSGRPPRDGSSHPDRLTVVMP